MTGKSLRSLLYFGLRSFGGDLFSFMRRLLPCSFPCEQGDDRFFAYFCASLILSVQLLGFTIWFLLKYLP